MMKKDMVIKIICKIMSNILVLVLVATMPMMFMMILRSAIAKVTNAIWNNPKHQFYSKNVTLMP